MKKTTFLFAAAALLATVAIGGNPRLYWYGGPNASVPKNYQTWNLSSDSSFWFDPAVQIPDFPVNLYSSYTAGATAIFDETAAAGSDTIRIDGSITADSLLFNNTRTYVLRSKTSYTADSIRGTGVLVKDGAGTLVMDCKNSLAGGTVLNSGKITIEKTTSPNVFGSKLVVKGGTVNFASGTASTYPNITLPIEIPAGATAKVELNRYSYWTSPITGSGNLEIAVGGDRCMLATSKSGSAVNWKNFTGNVTLKRNVISGVSPLIYGLLLGATKTFDQSSLASAISTSDSLMYNKVVTLKAGAGFASCSGVRCWNIGELRAENDSSFLSGYGAGASTTPQAYYMFGGLNTDVVFPGTIIDNGLSGGVLKGYNWVGLVKIGTGKYTFTSTKNTSTVSLGVTVWQGTFLVDIPLTYPATTTALGRVKNTVMNIKPGAIGGGQGRLTGTVYVDSLGTLVLGNNSIGQLELADTLKGTIACPLSVHHYGKAIFKVASKTSHDYLTSNSTVTFRGGTLLVKGETGVSLSAGDTVRLLTYKKAGTTKDSISLQTEGLPTGLKYTLKGDTLKTVTSTVVKDANNVPLVSVLTGGDSIKVTTTITEYRINLIVGVISGVNSVINNSVSVYPSLTSGLINIDSKDADITKVEVFNINGQQVMTQAIGARNAVLHLDKFASGLYYTRVTIGNKVETHKVLLK